MGRRVGFGNFQYEHVENWPKQPIGGAAADVAIDSTGRIYVGVRNDQPDGSLGTSKGGTGHVVVLDRDGNEIGNWGNFASASHGLWVNQEDEVFFADTGFHTISKHAPNGEVLLSLGTKGQPGAPGAPFNRPTHAVQAPNGDIFVSDGYGQNRIHRFSAKGEHILSFGSGLLVFGEPNPGPASTGPGEFNVPHDVVVDGDSRVIVSDRENDRVQIFTIDGEFVSMWTPVMHSNKIQIDPDGLLHIIGAKGVEVRNPDGTVVGSWADWGDGPGQFVRGPHGGWLDSDGSFYTAEAGFRNRLQKFVRV